jgi:ABC-type antimicrobial peptide transport system permease subunit
MLGFLELHLVASRLAELYAGWELPIVFPWPVTVLLLPLMWLASSAAALYPARIAARLVPAEALAAE